MPTAVHSAGGTQQAARLCATIGQRRHRRRTLLDGVRAARRERAPGRQARRIRRRAGDLAQAVALGALAPAGSPPAARPCTGARARRTPLPVAPSSTTWPPYITSTRWATRATTPRSWVTHTTAIDISSRRRPTRAMICCWIVTSRAVVGSSAISTFGPQRQRHGDDDALAHAAGELVRIRPCRPCRPGDADVGEHLDRRGRAPPAATFRGRAAPRRSAPRRASAGSATSSGPGTPSPSRRRARRACCVVVHRQHVAAVEQHLAGRRSRPAAPGAAPSPTASSATSRSPTRRRAPPSRRRATSKSTSSTTLTGPPSRCSTVVSPRTDSTASVIRAPRRWSTSTRRLRRGIDRAGTRQPSGDDTAEHDRPVGARSPTARCRRGWCTVRKPRRANR